MDDVPDTNSSIDLALLDRARRGDFSAFESLVDRHRQRLYGLAMRLTGQRQDAEDVVQQTFLSVLEHMVSFRGESAVATWILRIATNHALKILRKRRGLPIATQPPAADPDDDYSRLPHPEFIAEWRAGPGELVQRAEVRRLLDEALADLDDKYRLVFLLRDVEGLSVRETAEALDLTEANVKVRLLRARLVLRERLTRLYGDEAKQLFPDHEHG